MIWILTAKRSQIQEVFFFSAALIQMIQISWAQAAKRASKLNRCLAAANCLGMGPNQSCI